MPHTKAQSIKYCLKYIQVSDPQDASETLRDCKLNTLSGFLEYHCDRWINAEGTPHMVILWNVLPPKFGGLSA